MAYGPIGDRGVSDGAEQGEFGNVLKSIYYLFIVIGRLI